MFEFDALETEEVRVYKPIVLHEDADEGLFQAASRSIDQLLWQGSSDVAKAVTLFGPGIVVLPLFGRVSGVEDKRCLSYESHPKRAARNGIMDRVDLESKFGQMDPRGLVEELKQGRPGLERRLGAMTDEELQEDVVAMQDWRSKAQGRLKTLEKRAAWAFLGIPPGRANNAQLKKAFKRKALELHPDKGGDVERFQLLQEMKDLLIEPSQKELENMAKEDAEREKEQKEAQDKDKEGEEKDKKDEDEKSDPDLCPDDSDWSSDSLDVDEELRKMFPKKKKKKKRKDDDDDDDQGLGVGQEFNRDRHLAARRKLHRVIVEMWERAGKLSEEIQRSDNNHSGGTAVRQLRKFVERFNNVEVSKLKENDPQKAMRIYRRFLEQGSEVICASGAVDPVATVSSIAMHINMPLMQMVPENEDLKKKCNALLEAVKTLPSTFNKFVKPVESVMGGKAAATNEAAKQPIKVALLLPDTSNLVKTSEYRQEVEVPGIRKEELELPPGSTVGDLLAAATHLLQEGSAPRLFCGGRFLGSHGAELASIDELREGMPVQCLPSNRTATPSQKPLPNYPTAQAGRAQGEAVKADEPATPAKSPGSAEKAEAEESAQKEAAAKPHALPADAVNGKKKDKTTSAGADGDAGWESGSGALPSVAELLAGLDVEEAEEEVKKAEEIERLTAEQDAKAQVERQAAQAEDEEGEDPFFAEFFEDTKRNADEVEEKLRQEKARKAIEERRKKEEREKEEERMRLEQKELKKKQQQEAQEEQRNEQREKTQSAMEARLAAQKKALEAKKRLELEKKKALKAQQQEEEARLRAKSEQDEAKQRADQDAARVAEVRRKVEEEKKRRAAEQAKLAAAKVETRAIVKEKDPSSQALKRIRSSWDPKWENPCCGKKKGDGSAVWCHPCDMWVHVGEPFDHRGFELHCEKVGHYGWID